MGKMKGDFEAYRLVYRLWEICISWDAAEIGRIQQKIGFSYPRSNKEFTAEAEDEPQSDSTPPKSPRHCLRGRRERRRMRGFERTG